MLDTYRKLLAILTPRERRQTAALALVFLVVGALEVVGVASVVPFIYAAANPDAITENAYLAAAFHFSGLEDSRSFLVVLGMCVFGLVVSSLAFKGFSQYATHRFTHMRGHSISNRLLQGYLHQPYPWFLSRNSAEISSTVLAEVTNLVSRCMLPAMKLVASSIIVALLVSLLLLAQPMVALTAALALGLSYGLIFFGIRRLLERLGKKRRLANRARYQSAQEATGGLKEMKVGRLEGVYLERFRVHSKRMAVCDASIGSLSEVPRYALEAVAFGGLLFFVLFLLHDQDVALLDIIPVLALYAFAGVRLMPALQAVFSSLTSIRFAKPTLDKIYADLHECRVPSQDRRPLTPPLRLNSRLELDDVSFKYSGSSRSSLTNLNLCIDARKSYGVVGGTGAGKTTLVDLVLGLLTPYQGTVRVDGTVLTPENMHAWQRSIGYVPQEIFLTDDTLAANIALGLDLASIDMAAVERAAQLAELHGFIVSELPQGYNTLVGERGVRLSGGQRQRIGIARALYNDPDVLVFDEATSALDNVTERAVMQAVRNLAQSKTIIMVAHRLSTVRDCETIFMLDQGSVVAAGSYEQLMSTSESFRALAGESATSAILQPAR